MIIDQSVNRNITFESIDCPQYGKHEINMFKILLVSVIKLQALFECETFIRIFAI